MRATRLPTRSLPDEEHTAAPATKFGASPVAPFAFQNMLGSSAALRQAISLGCRVAVRDTTVLLKGDTGTGKELFARGIHHSSLAADAPFVAINCAALPEHLLESELFGHERGAFSGAHNHKQGLFEFAGRGTVFLDEIGELPLALQPKLLRVLEEKVVRRVGGLTERAVSCRIIAATNRDLLSMCARGRFREDLYYRISTFTLVLPPLRERGEDVILLARYFASQRVSDMCAEAVHFSSAASNALRAYSWPGNIRELKNVIETALILADGPEIGVEHLRFGARSETEVEDALVHNPPISAGSVGMTLAEAERELIGATLRFYDGNQTRAAAALGISRATLVRRVRQWRIADAH